MLTATGLLPSIRCVHCDKNGGARQNRNSFSHTAPSLAKADLTRRKAYALLPTERLCLLVKGQGGSIADSFIGFCDGISALSG